jgi:hypothetical protein
MNRARFCFNYFYMTHLHRKSAHLPMIELSWPKMLHYTLSLNAQRIARFSDSSSVDLDASGNTVYVSSNYGYAMGDAIAVATISTSGGHTHVPTSSVVSCGDDDTKVSVSTATAPVPSAVKRRRRGGSKKAATPAVAKQDAVNEKVLVLFQLNNDRYYETNIECYDEANTSAKHENNVWMQKARGAGINKIIAVFVTSNDDFDAAARGGRYYGPDRVHVLRIDSLL